MCYRAAGPMAPNRLDNCLQELQHKEKAHGRKSRRK